MLKQKEETRILEQKETKETKSENEGKPESGAFSLRLAPVLFWLRALAAYV